MADTLRIIFVNRFFYPDHSATSQILSAVAFAIAGERVQVEVIASRLRYDGAGPALSPHQVIRGVTIHRMWSSCFGRANLIGRALDYLTFYAAAGWTLWRRARQADIIIAKTDPPMLSIIAAPVARLRGAKLINWLQDIFPEVAQAAGVGSGRLTTYAYQCLQKLRDASLRAAHCNVVLGDRMAAQLEARGLPAQQIRKLANFADGGLIRPLPATHSALRARLGLAATFVIGYSGNFGRVHEYQTLLAAIVALQRPHRPADPAKGEPDPVDPVPFAWLIIGGGALYDELRHHVTARGLANVHFLPYQAEEMLADSLAAADVHIVSLRPEFEGLIVPSKFYGIAAAGRPTVFIGDPDGEIARLLSQHACGHTVRVGDGEGLARMFHDLALDPHECRAMGERARAAFEAEFDKPIAIARWGSLLREIGREK